MKKPKNRTVERNETKTERETVPKEPTLVGKIVGGSIFGYVNIEKKMRIQVCMMFLFMGANWTREEEKISSIAIVAYYY